jgi:peptidoglycan pentaglycine glycine transferase (the first glycine)
VSSQERQSWEGLYTDHASFGAGVGFGGFELTMSSTPVDLEWDEFVDMAPGGHHLQTTHWARVKSKLGWRAMRIRVQRDDELLGGCQLLVRPMRVGSIAYCPRGPLARNRDPKVVQAVLDSLALVAHRERILYVKVQPPAGGGAIEPMLRSRGFVESSLYAAPVATVLVDLKREPDEILAGMRSSGRANIRKAQRRGLVVREAGASGLEAFGQLLSETSRRQNFSPYPLENYAEMLRQFGEGQRAQLLLVESAGQPLSGALIIGYGDTVVYKMGAWSGERSTVRPNELMHWHAMQWARERGYAHYDLEGILEPVARAKLAGHELPAEGSVGTTHFKLGMGGEVTLYPRAYDRSFHRLLVWPARMLAPQLERFRTVAHRLAGREH